MNPKEGQKKAGVKAVWILPFSYALVFVVGVFFGGAGHGPGIALIYCASLPGALLVPQDMLWVVAAGSIQWMTISFFIHRWVRRRRTGSGGGTEEPKTEMRT